MSRLIYTKNAPLSFFDWRTENIVSVYAGHSCVMARTERGEILQKVSDGALAARTEYWRNIRSVSISQCCPALAVGLVNDGTCMIGKRAARRCCEIFGGNFELVNSRLKELKDITEVCVSDAIFALDKHGKVHCITFGNQKEYQDVSRWENIVHIAVGNQCSVFGITGDGTVLCSGYNCISGPHHDVREKLASFKNVVDVCALGSECERILLALGDGTVTDLNGNTCGIRHNGISGVFCSNFGLAAVHSADGFVEFVSYCCREEELEKFQNKKFSSVAVGVGRDGMPFVAAVEGEREGKSP